MVSNGERRREGHHLKLCVCTRRYTPNAKLSQLLVQRRVVGAIKHISEKTSQNSYSIQDIHVLLFAATIYQETSVFQQQM